MCRITINTDINAPYCPCEILSDDGRSILVQTDWDYPGFANSFGWSVRDVQRCPECGSCNVSGDESGMACKECGQEFEPCYHDQTDGTVNCKYCDCTASDFIQSAGEFLESGDGLETDDPGYFDEVE